MLLVLDNGSVYTKNLTEFLTKKNFQFEKQTPKNFDLKDLEKYDSFILSGRRENNKQTNHINSKIISHSIINSKKLLGICYGAEILALALGGTIKKTLLQKGKENVAILRENMICSNSLEVFESHQFEISKLPDSLIAIGSSNNCKYEVIQYKHEPIFGTQFHPEMSIDGQNLITKFCSI